MNCKECALERQRKKARERYHKNKDPQIIKRKIRGLLEIEIMRLENDEVEYFDSVLYFREIEEKLDKLFNSEPVVLIKCF